MMIAKAINQLTIPQCYLTSPMQLINNLMAPPSRNSLVILKQKITIDSTSLVYSIQKYFPTEMTFPPQIPGPVHPANLTFKKQRLWAINLWPT